MPKALKVILAVVGVFCVVCVIAAVVGVKYAKQAGSQFVNEARSTVNEARGYATGRDGNACVTEGLRRSTACTGVVCEGLAQVFTRTCLERASDSPGMCANVPRDTDIMASASWSIGRCDALGHNGDQKCLRLIKAVQEYCIGRMFQANQTGGGNPGAQTGPSAPAAPAAPAAPVVPVVPANP